MYPRSFLCEEAKIKQCTPSKKELCGIREEAIWESRCTYFFLTKRIKILTNFVCYLEYLLKKLPYNCELKIPENFGVMYFLLEVHFQQGLLR